MLFRIFFGTFYMAGRNIRQFYSIGNNPAVGPAGYARLVQVLLYLLRQRVVAVQRYVGNISMGSELNMDSLAAPLNGCNDAVDAKLVTCCWRHERQPLRTSIIGFSCFLNYNQKGEEARLILGVS
jgi:hypothetical protein